MQFKKIKRVSHRSPHNKDSRIHTTSRIYIVKQKIGSFLKRYIRALKKRNIRTIIFTAVVAFIFIVLPVVLAITLSNPKQAQTGADDMLASDTQGSVSDTTGTAPAVTVAPSPSPSPIPTPTPTPEPTPVLLAYGDENPTVIEIQERLMELGYLDYCDTSEHFGSSTEAAVKLFQRQKGEEQTGIVDDDTYKSMMSTDAEDYVLYLEAKGEDVRAVQDRLYQLGYLAEKSSVTGYFGDLTEEAVKSFQQNNDLTADGKIGAFTFEALYGQDAKANILSYGTESAVVLKYQGTLKTLAYLTTEPDGKYGNDTTAAVKLFQEKNGLIVDGYLGPATRDLLDSGEALPNALSIGDSGNTVLNVQKMLVQANCLESSSTTGYYGSVTEAAVRLFQATNKLSIDGKAGKQTIGLLSAGDFAKAASPITSGSVGSSPSVDKAADLIAIARTKLGAPYVRGAKGPDRFDCSGFVYWVLNQAGIKQSYLTTYGWRSTTKYTRITDINALKPGDLILFHIDGLSSTRGHIGIVTTDTLMIHALGEVKETSYKQTYWKTRFICAYRIY